MYKRKVFIGGSITAMIHNGGFDQKYKSFVEKIINKLKCNFEILSAYIEEDYGKNILDDVETTKRDLEWIEKTDICIFILPLNNNAFVRSDGMFVELGYALKRKCKIYFLCDLSYVESLSPMIKGTSGVGVCFKDIRKFTHVIDEMLEGEKNDI